MGFFRRAERVEDRALTADTVAPMMVSPVLAGEGVSQRHALGIASVFAAVRVLTDSAILCPLRCYREQADGSRERVTTGRLTDLLARPGPAMTGPALTAQLVKHITLFGEAFIGKIRTDGVLTGLEALPPDRVAVEVSHGIPSYTYYATGQVFDDLTTSDVVHVCGMTRHEDGIRGVSPITECREAFGLASALTTAASATWQNGSIPAGLLRVAAGPNAKDKAESLASAWRERQQGPQNRGRVGVITGDVEWISVGMSLQDALWAEQVRLNLQDVARIFGIPPSKLNIESGNSLTYSTVESENIDFVTTALMPRLRLIEAAVSADPDLCTSPMYVEYLIDGLLRGDSTSRAAFYTAALNPVSGWMQRSEVRRLENLPDEKDPPAPAPGAKPLTVEDVLKSAEPTQNGVTNG